MIWFRSFADELLKVAARLTEKEQRNQALQFAALGAVGAPIASMASKFVESGKFFDPESLKGPGGVKRWIAGQAIRGALAGGILPIARHAIERRTEESAAERERRYRFRRAKAMYNKNPKAFK